MKRIVKEPKKQGFFRKTFAGAVAGVMALTMAAGLMQPAADAYASGKTANIEGFSAAMIADPDTSEDDHIFNGTPAEDGKIWTDKSVTTGAMFGVAADEENFTVALSALAQTYNTVETSVSTEQENIAFDVVFVLDFSGSMNYRMDSEYNASKAEDTRAYAMVDALNPAIATLMESANNRVAVVGYSGSDVSSGSAETLLGLDHYTTTTTNTEGENQYFVYAKTPNNRISIVDGVTDAEGNTESRYKQVNGGTPTQRGIYHGMTILQNASHPKDGITRIPVMVLLTDGKAGSARSAYTTLSGGTLYEGSANNEDEDERVGAYTILTANYAKDQIQAAYDAVYDYDEDMSAKFFTIGLAIDKDEWTHFMLDPGTEDAEGDTVVSGRRGIKYYVESDTTYGDDYDYADNYFGGQMTAEELKTYFGDIVNSLKMDPTVSSTVNDPISSESTEAGTADSDVVFTDYLGYKMELKGDSQYLRYGGINYRFDKQADNTYVFSGYDQSGNTVISPAVTKGDTTYTLANVTFKAEWVNETYNGQAGYWKVTWSFPSVLLPTYSRLNDYDNTNVDPIRMIYQVGLAEDTDLQEDALKITSEGALVTDDSDYDQLVFHTNLYDYDSENGGQDAKAMTWSQYKPASDNPFYYETGYTTDSALAGTTDEYIRLDVIAEKAEAETISGTANIVLTNISLSLYNARATFVYNGETKTVSLSGGSQSGSVWTGEVSIPVTAYTEDGEAIEQNVSVRINAQLNSYYYSWLSLTSVTVLGETAALSSNNTTATASVTLSKEVESETQTGEQLVSIYLKLQEDEKGYYVVDAAGKRIDVNAAEDGSYTIKLGDKTYYSVPYYKYKDGSVDYVEKSLDKGTIAKSLVGQFEITQPGTEELTEKNYQDFFKYYPSNYADSKKTYSVTDVLFHGGEHWGDIDPDESITEPAEGTIKVLVSDIRNGQTDVNGNPMVVNFVFTLEEQKLSDGKTQYVVVDCEYWEEGENTYAVDMIISQTAEITEDGKYLYDVSYTIESVHSSGEANVTQTDPRFFATDFQVPTVTALLGNNGRLSVSVEDVYDKDVKAQKEWRDALGNLVPVTDASLADVTITAGLYQVYSYTDAEGNTVTHNAENGNPFMTVELNYTNGFTYTWDNLELPKYLVSAGGDYVLDENEAKVPVTYEVGEVTGAAGWILSDVAETEEDGTEVFTLVNVPTADFTPSVEKIWTVDGEETTAPEGYKVQINLLKKDGTEIVPVYKRTDSAKQVPVTLTQSAAGQDAQLAISYGEVALEAQPVLASDFTEENTSKTYTFVYDPEGGFGGAAGSGTHADSADLKVTITNTSGDRLGITNVVAVYHFTVNGVAQELSVTAVAVSSEETDTTKTAMFELRNKTNEAVSVVLDGTESWEHTWENLNLPLIEYDEENQSYKNITYLVEEILLVPDSSEEDGFAEYSVGTNGLIIVPSEDGNRVFKATIESTDDYQFTVTNDEGLTRMTAEKVWADNDNAYNTRPDDITFTLYADGNPVEGSAQTIAPTGTTAGIWNGTDQAVWDNIPLYNETTGEEIEYSVVETLGTLPTADQYEITYETDPDDDHHIIVTNSLYADPAVNPTEMSVEKVWIDDNDAAGKRPDAIYMVLYRHVDGETAADAVVVPGTDSVITLTDDVLTGTWENLSKYNEDGKKYIYSVKEYDRLVTGATPGVTGYKDVSTAADKTETAYIFRNQLEDGAISKTVTKVWKDKALEAQRPESVTVKLSGSIAGEDGASVDIDLTDYDPEQTISDPWTYTWENLPEFKNGKKIDYTIEETTVGTTAVAEGKSGIYAVAVRDDGTGNSFTVTNTITGETTVTVNKEWENLPEGFAIPEVSFDVYNGLEGKQDITLTVTDENRSATSAALPKYNAEGIEYVYYLIEQPLPETETYRINSVIGSNEGTDGNFVYTATNTYESLVRDITGTKTWVDVAGDNIPAGITVELLRQSGDGEAEVVKDSNGDALQPEWTKTSENIWNYTYKDLPIYADADNAASRYVYSIRETEIGGAAVEDTDYSVSYPGLLDIKNTLDATVDGTDLDGTKAWVGVEAENVPDSITVELWRNIEGEGLERAVDTDGVTVAAITVSKTGQADPVNWTYDFGNITVPKYDPDGNLYIYSVKEISVTAGTTTREVVYTASEGTVGDYTVTLNGMGITNTLNEEKDETTEFTITKAWVVPSNTQLPSSITVQLMQDGVASGSALELTADNVTVETENGRTRWVYTFKNLRKYADDGITEMKYSIKETKIGEDAVTYTADAEGTAGEWIVGISPNGDFIINTRAATALTTITVNKKWEGVSGDNIPDSITVQLYQNDTEMGTPVEITAEQNWEHEFPYLQVSPDGTENNKYTYTVKEISVTADGVTEQVIGNIVGDYKVTYDDDGAADGKIEITNTLRSDDKDKSAEYPVIKNWSGVTGEDIPDSITIQLMQDGTDVTDGAVTLTKTDNAVEGNETQWSYTYTGLRKYTDNGITQYVYTAKETKIENTAVASSHGYLKSGDFFVTYTQQDQEKTIINNRLANAPEKELVEFPVEKQWLDAEGNALTSNLPQNITVQLYQNETAYGQPYTFTNADIVNGWKHTFVSLPKYTEDGLQEYVYTVQETKVGDAAVVNGAAGAYTVTVEGGTIKNVLTGPTTKAVTVTKKWEGVETSDPYTIKVTLLDDRGTEYGTAVLTKDNASADANTWTYTFTDLPIYRDGVTEIVYTVIENSVKVGETESRVVYDANGGKVGDLLVQIDGLEITNSLNDKKETTQLKVTKNWVVPSSFTLPNEITVALYRQAGVGEAEPVQKGVKITGSGTTWTYTFKDLPKYAADGFTEYHYSVKETHIGASVVEDNKAGVFTVNVNEAGNVITNTAATGDELYTSLTVTKQWVGVKGDNIPASITLALYRVGETEPYRTQVITGEGTEWTYTFDKLPRYIDGIKEHQYYVREVAVAGEGSVSNGKAGDYEVTQSENVITNTLSGTVEVSGKKIWADNSNADGKRPTSVIVELYQSIEGQEAVKVDEQTVTGSGDEWAFTFDNQTNGYAKYDENGNRYIYTVKEQGETNGLYTIRENGEISQQYRVTYDQEELTITNATPNAGTAVISGTKTMSGRKFLSSDQFEFKLEAKTANAPMPENATVTVTGIAEAESLAVEFGAITYTKEGTYLYEVSENNTGIGGVSYDPTVVNVTVTVVYSTDAEKYVATVTYGNSEENTGFTFNNSYQAAPDTATLSGKKLLTGRELGEEEFTFTIEAVSENAPMPTETTVKNTKDDQGKFTKVAFAPIEFKQAGEYQYKIRETKGSLAGVTYDEGYVVATVNVVDNKAGKLVASVSYQKYDKDGNKTSDSFEFTNSYSTKPTSVALTGEKTVEDESGAYVLTADAFTFKIECASTNPASDPYKSGTVKNTITEKDGKTIGQFVILTADKQFTEAGVYTYTITEVSTDAMPGIIYDSSSYQVTVTVTDDTKTGQLNAVTAIQKTKAGNTEVVSAVTFNNIYDPTVASTVIRGTKVLSGKDLKENDFEFILEAADDMAKKVLPEAKRVKNDQTGAFSFDTLIFKEVGTYRFKVTEVQGTLGGVTYDKSEYIVVVEVTGEEVKTEVMESSKDETTPPADGETTPPADGETTPSADGETTPSTDGEETTPPADGETTPSTDGEETPPSTDGETTPSTDGETTPSTDGETTPSTDGETTPSTDGETTPSTDGETTPSTDEEATPASEEPVLPEENIFLDTGWKFNPLQFILTGTNGTAESTEPETETAAANTGKLYAKVTIQKNGEAAAAIVFNNKYTPGKVTIGKDTQIPLKGTKTLNGRTLQAGEFEFTITPGDEAYPMPSEKTVTNAADGSFEFGQITFSKAGIYYYTIAENNNHISGIEYDETSYTVKVTVIDDGNGKLQAAVAVCDAEGKEASVAFANKYSAASTGLRLTAIKQLKGRTLKAEEFEFEITAVTEDAPMPASVKAKNNADGIVIFDEIRFAAAGDYTYKVKEIKGSEANVTYDTQVYEVVVHVTDNLEGQLVASVDESFAGMKFVNEYKKPEETKTTDSTPDPTPDSTPETDPEPTPVVQTIPIVSPITGDLSNPIIWLAVVIVAAAGGFFVSKRKK